MNAATTNVNTEKSVEFIPLSNLVLFTLGNSRVTHNKSKRDQLLESIRVQGVITPITVRPSSTNDIYEVVAGFGRYNASVELELDSIPALIKPMTDSEAYEIQLSENLVRDDLTLVDECKAAQRFVSLHEGSHIAAAARLGWSTKKLNERLELLRCSDKVLDALNTDVITIAHAVVLSSFSHKLQDGTLVKIIDEKWSVKTLRERAGRAKKFIHTAKFNVDACNACQHNTSRQSSMFDTEKESKSQCAKLSCWNEKTTEWLKEQRKKAEEKHGKVLLFIESSVDDRNTVSENIVGKVQFDNCGGCESKVAIIDDRYPQEGNIISSQCLDKVCFNTCVKSFDLITNPPAIDNSVASKESCTNSKSSAEVSTVAPVIQKTPASVTLHERNTMREASQEVIKNAVWFRLGVQLASLHSTSGYQSPLFDSVSSFNERVAACHNQSEITLLAEIDLSINYLAQTHADDNAHSTSNPTDLMIQSLSTIDNAHQVIKAAWSCDAKTLKNYTVQGLVALCNQAKFDIAFDNDEMNINKKMSFDKASSKSKSDFIKAILAFKFDAWKDFAPQTYISHLKK